MFIYYIILRIRGHWEKQGKAAAASISCNWKVGVPWASRRSRWNFGVCAIGKLLAVTELANFSTLDVFRTESRRTITNLNTIITLHIFKWVCIYLVSCTGLSIIQPSFHLRSNELQLLNFNAPEVRPKDTLSDDTWHTLLKTYNSVSVTACVSIFYLTA